MGHSASSETVTQQPAQHNTVQDLFLPLMMRSTARQAAVKTETLVGNTSNQTQGQVGQDGKNLQALEMEKEEAK
ncbi:hypothetical protein INR49_023869 [Caranx melampygus]|nr:hypothetical protein INR49_023869 [Caranx melampygus]